jgi:formate/nitrite transporter
MPTARAPAPSEQAGRATAPAPLDALVPREMAERAVDIGVVKAHLDAGRTFTLGVLAGAFIALGAAFSTVVLTGADALPHGIARLAAGLAFSLGLILVSVGGAELFTGNNLIVMAWASRRVSTTALLRNWLLVYAGNLVGAVATAAIVHASGAWRQAGGEVGRTAIAMASAKISLDPLEAVALGALCNALVCLAVWLTMSARSTADRVLAVVPPVAAFVACGFEHSVANMYLLPFALLVDHGAPGLAASAALTWRSIWFDNLLPVTLGNMVGGAGMVGLVYWSIYLRGAGDPDR